MTRLTCSCTADMDQFVQFLQKYMKSGNTTLTFNYFMEWILHMICFEFKIAEANFALTTPRWVRLVRSRLFNVVVLQHVNNNYGLKQSPGFLPVISLIFYQNAVTSYFCLLTVLVAEYRSNDYVLVSRHETTFSLCGKRFVLGARAFWLHLYRSGKMACPRSKKCR